MRTLKKRTPPKTFQTKCHVRYSNKDARSKEQYAELIYCIKKNQLYSLHGVKEIKMQSIWIYTTYMNFHRKRKALEQKIIQWCIQSTTAYIPVLQRINFTHSLKAVSSVIKPSIHLHLGFPSSQHENWCAFLHKLFVHKNMGIGMSCPSDELMTNLNLTEFPFLALTTNGPKILHKPRNDGCNQNPLIITKNPPA